MLPLDDPLLALLVDPRGALPRLGDNLWVRLLDVPTALTARRYCAPVDAVLEVSDDLLPANAGRCRLTTAPYCGGAGGAGRRGAAGSGAHRRSGVRLVGRAAVQLDVLGAAAYCSVPCSSCGHHTARRSATRVPSAVRGVPSSRRCASASLA